MVIMSSTTEPSKIFQSKSVTASSHRRSTDAEFADDDTISTSIYPKRPKPIVPETPKIVSAQPSNTQIQTRRKGLSSEAIPRSEFIRKKAAESDSSSASSGSMLKPPPGIPGIPTGLAFLIPTIFVFVKPRPNITEVATDLKARRHYDLIDELGKRLYVATESPDCCESMTLPCGQKARAFRIEILDFYGRKILILNRQFDPLLYCSCGTGGGSMTVDLDDGTCLGKITHSLDCYAPTYSILDKDKKVVMKIEGTRSTCMDCYTCWGINCWSKPRTDFDIIGVEDGDEIGVIRKNFTGYVQPFVSANPNNFGVEFRGYLDVKWKALVIAAVFLIDIMYFQKNQPAPSLPK